MSKIILVSTTSTENHYAVNIKLLDEDVNVNYVYDWSNNDLFKIEKLLRKYSIIIGYDFRRFEGAVLGYALYGSPNGPNDIYNFQQELIKSRESGNIRQNKDFAEYTKRLNFLKVIDLKHANSLNEPDLLRVGISIGVNEIKPLNSFKLSDILIHNENKNYVLEKLFDLSKDNLRVRKILSKRFGWDLTAHTNSDLSKYIVQKNYMDLSGQSYNDILNNRWEYDEIIINEILPDFTFVNKTMNDVYQKLKSFVVTPNNKINFTVTTKEMNHSIKQGGLHSKNKPCIYDDKSNDLIYIDFNTFYGNLIVKHKIKPIHLTDDFITVVRNLVKDREDAIGVDIDMANAIKVAIASISGNLKSKSSIYRDYKASIQLYLTGQLTLLKIIDEIELCDEVSCILSNTDGFVIKIDKKVSSFVEDKLTEILFNVGIPYKRVNLSKLIIKDLNNYIMVTDYGVVEGIGIFKDKGRVNDSLNAPIIGKAIINYFLYGKPIPDTIRDEKDIVNFCSGETPRPPINLFKADLKGCRLINNTARYFVSIKAENLVVGNPGSKTQKSMINGYGLALANTLNNDDLKYINFKYYIEKANYIVSDIEDKQLSLF